MSAAALRHLIWAVGDRRDRGRVLVGRRPNKLWRLVLSEAPTDTAGILTSALRPTGT